VSTALVVSELSMSTGTGAGYGALILQAVSGERRDVGDGRDLYRWIERTTASADDTSSDLTAMLYVGVRLKVDDMARWWSATLRGWARKG
jgi:hypothetical protein